MRDAAILEVVRQHAVPVDLDSAAERLLEAIDPTASVVLVGEGRTARRSSIGSAPTSRAR